MTKKTPKKTRSAETEAAMQGVVDGLNDLEERLRMNDVLYRLAAVARDIMSPETSPAARAAARATWDRVERVLSRPPGIRLSGRATRTIIADLKRLRRAGP